MSSGSSAPFVVVLRHPAMNRARSCIARSSLANMAQRRLCCCIIHPLSRFLYLSLERERDPTFFSAPAARCSASPQHHNNFLNYNNY
jgi:hypothetical protein